MESLDSALDALWETKWIRIPGLPYIIKHRFLDDHYTVMITNLNEIYGETLTVVETLDRFVTINPYCTMKPKVIIAKVKQSLEDVLSGEDNYIQMQCFPEHFTLRLHFSACQATFLFDLCPALLSGEKLRTYVIAPIILTTMHTCLENAELQKKIETSEKSAASSPHKSKHDPKMKLMMSLLNKKSKVHPDDVLEAFLLLQNNIKNSVSDTEYQDDTVAGVNLEQNIPDPSLLLQEDDKDLSPSLRYEDDTETDSSESLLKSAEIYYSHKRELDFDEDPVPSTADPNDKESDKNGNDQVKLKKKKPLNI